MISLIVTLISISLFALLLTMGVSTINTSTIKEEAWHNELKVSIPSIERAISNYVRIHGEMPDVLTWNDDVFPGFGVFPSLSFDGTFEYQLIAGEYYICFNANYSEVLNKAYDRVIANHNYAFMKGKSCGVTEAVDSANPLVLSYEL